MNSKRKIEVFSAGCPACEDTVKLIHEIACESCDIIVLDMHDPKVSAHAKSLGVRSVPAVAVNGKLAGCCAERGPDAASLRQAGVGQLL